MRKMRLNNKPVKKALTALAFVIVLLGMLYGAVPPAITRAVLLICGAAVFVLSNIWDRCEARKQSAFANDICETVDALMDGREPGNYRPYEDSPASKAQEKLLQFYERVKEGQRQSERDKQTIQELVSDISHQVKTPVANLQMFAGILQQHKLSEEKQAEFLDTMSGQINKLDFLMQSLIKMSRLETGTFTLHMEKNSLYKTIAHAVNGIWAKADCKNIQIDVDCGSSVTVKHDTKWTAEALGNILDNAVKYTPEGGAVRVSVRPWQFYTRIDIEDTGIGIPEKHFMMCLNGSTVCGMWLRRKGWALDCIWRAVLLPGKKVISA